MSCPFRTCVSLTAESRYSQTFSLNSAWRPIFSMVSRSGPGTALNATSNVREDTPALRAVERNSLVHFLKAASAWAVAGSNAVRMTAAQSAPAFTATVGSFGMEPSDVGVGRKRAI